MSLEIITTALPNALIICPKVIADARGHFIETFRLDQLAEKGFTKKFIQENQSLSTSPYTLRGLHFQKPPHAQDKLVRVNQGSILDVAVDIRAGSPTYGQHIAVELTADNFKQLLIPAGFAHGFITLEPDTVVSYKVSQYYAPEADSGIAWDDPDLAIAWSSDQQPILSEKDTRLPQLKDLPADLFPYNDFSF